MVGFFSASAIHVCAVHALLSMHAYSCTRLVDLQFTTTRPGFIGRSAYYIFLQHGALHTGIQVPTVVPSDARARMAETRAFSLGGDGMSLPGDVLTIGLFCIYACIGGLCVRAVAFGRQSPTSLFAPALASIAATLSSGVSLCLLLLTDRDILWPTRTGPFLSSSNLAICVAVAACSYTAVYLSLSKLRTISGVRAPRSTCRCGYDLTGLTGSICPECGKHFPTSGGIVRLLWDPRAKYRLTLLVLWTLCITPIGVLCSLLLPLHWQVFWDSRPVTTSPQFVFGITRRPPDYPIDEWNAYGERVQAQRRDPGNSLKK
jgi:hypothetical protein